MRISFILILAFAIRIFLSVLYVFYDVSIPLGFSYPDSKNDEVFFYEIFMRGEFSFYNTDWTYSLFPFLARYSLGLFSTSKFALSLFNIIISVFTIKLVYLHAKKLFNVKSAQLSALILALLPMNVVYSFLHVRESLVIFLFVFFIYIYHLNKWKNLSLIFFIISFWLLFILHNGFVILLPFVLLKSIDLFKFGNLSKYFLLVVSFGLFAIYFKSFEIGYIDLFLEGDPFSYIEDRYSRKFETLDERFLLSQGDFNFQNQYLSFLFRPYVHEYAAGMLRVPNSILIYFCFTLILFNFFRLSGILRTYLLIFFVVTSVFSIGSLDLYQSDRHRSKVLPFLLSITPFHVLFKRDQAEN
jgi:hypothetical protein